MPIEYKKLAIKDRKTLLKNKDTLKRYEVLKANFLAIKTI